MKATRAPIQFERLPQDYAGLCGLLMPRVVRDKVDLENVRAMADAMEALRHLLDEHGMSGADLSRLLGAHRTLGGMILRGERKLTVDHVRALSAYFGVPADLFLS